MAPANGVPLEYLTDIYDTPRPGDTSPATSSFAHHTHLVYTQPPWTPSIIAPVWKASPTFVLSRVDVTSQDFNAAGAREQVRRYYLTYTSFATLTSDGPPAVYTVQLEGNCSGAGGWVSGTANNVEINGQLPDPTKSAKCPTRPATEFTYAPIVSNLEGEAAFTPQGVVMPSLSGSAASPMLFDLDNNGLPDLLAPASGSASMNNGTATFASQPIALGTPGGTPAPLNTLGQLASAGQSLQTGRFQIDGRFDMMWVDIAGAEKVIPATYPDPQGNPPGNPLYSDTAVNYEWVDVSPPTSSSTAWTLTPSASISTFNLLLKYPAWPNPSPTPEASCSGGWAFIPPQWGELAAPVNETFALGSEGAIASLDVDGDGVTDLLTVTGFTLQDDTQGCADVWSQYSVRFSKRAFDYSYAPFFGAAPSSATAGARTDVCVGGLPADQQNALSPTANAFGDLDGDGIVDLLQWGAQTTTWWPGHGDGVFGMCPSGINGLGATSGGPVECACGSAVGIALPVLQSSSGPVAIPAGAVAAIHDVTGDGLGDIIVSGMPYPGELSVFVNKGLAVKGVPSFGDSIPVTVNALLGWSGNASPTSLYFADMNGSGVDDIIVQETPAGGSKATSLGYIDLYTGGPDGTESLRPGLLTDISDGLGLTTHVTYATTVQLANEATPPWTSPQPLHVVASVTASDSTGDSYTTTYTYSGPVFDGHDNRFLGFQNVTQTTPGAAAQLMNTETTYFYAACTGPGAAACGTGTHYPSASYRGLPTLTEVFDGVNKQGPNDPSSPTYLSTTHHSYAGQVLYEGNDNRTVTYVYEKQTDTFLYDTAPFLPVLNRTQSIADVDLSPYPPALVPVRGSVARHLQKTMALDIIGNLTSVVDSGDVGDVSSTPPDPVITHSVMWSQPTPVVDTTNNWIWRPQVMTTGTRTTTLGYDPQGNLIDVTRTLAGTAGLPRNSLGVGVPADASAGSGNAHVAHITYDPAGTGNLLHVQMYPSSTSNNDPPRCTEFTYDAAYAQLRTSEIVDVGDCGSPQAITTQHIYDRILNVETSAITPAGGQSAATYDGFGRVATVAKPDPTTGLPLAPSTTITYADVSTYGQLVHTNQAADPTGNYPAYDTYAYLDAFGRTIQVASTADGAGQWVLSNQVHRDVRGRVDRAYVPHFVTGDPTALYSYAPPTVQGTTAAYDAFSRVTQTADIDGTVTSAMRYHALSVESRDAEQSLTSGIHYGAYVMTTRDGHGRTVEVDEHEHTATGVLSTVIVYQATGEATSISRSGTNSNGVSVSYARSMQYDTLGRLVRNLEPNTSSWTYAYNDLGDLVGTADARGCGENLHYDGAGRLLYEDFSPCQAPPMQMAYTTPSPNGDGTEAFYAYEGGALQTGAVSDISDRASHTHFHHDMRGRLTEVDRWLAAPGTDPTMALSVPSALSARYSSAVFSTVTGYDDRDRPRTQTTGADTPDLLASNGTSTVTGTYSPRGILESVTSSYGPIINGTVVEADGRTDSVTYADAAKTTISYAYNDSRLRLSETKIWRAGSFPTAQGSYTPPAPGSAQPTQQNVVADDVLPTTAGYAAYDAVGNPTQINDNRLGGVAQWPSGYEPVSRAFTYDDSYRLLTATQTFPSTTDVYQPPTAQATATTSPVPLTTGGNRVLQQTFAYDGLGNTLSTTDDAQTFFDRSLGTITPGTSTNTLASGPNQLAAATLGSSTTGNTGGLNATYDHAGNMVQLAVQRNGRSCTSTTGCKQLFQYDWDEVGRLSRARRFDFVGGDHCINNGKLHLCYLNPLPSNYPYPTLPTSSPNADVSYAYAAGGTRVLRASVHSGETTTYSAEIFPSLRLNHTQWVAGAYEVSATTEVPYLTLGGSAVYGRLVYNPQAPSLPSSTELPFQHVFLELTDSLGSTSAVIDKDTSELVERSTYLAYGALESDYRPDRWMMSDGTELQSFAEDYKFTGKEDDAEIGLTYFGARYYAPQLGHWVSPDPLAIHALSGDPNPYAYVHGHVTTATDPVGLDDSWGPDDVCGCCNGCGQTVSVPGTTTTVGPAAALPPATGLPGPAYSPTTVSLFSPRGLQQWANSPIDPAAVAGFNQGVNRNSTVIALTGGLAVAQAGVLAVVTGGAGVSALRAAYTAVDTALGTAANAVGNAVTNGLGSLGRAVVGGIGAIFGTGAAAAGNCFAAGTLVATCDGGEQPIESLREHDRVLSESEQGAVECREVVRTFERLADDRATVTIAEDGESETLHTTLEHRFWLMGRGWTPVRELNPGDALQSLDGTIRVVRATAGEPGSGRVFNVEVQGNHDYFVGEARALVHNACGDVAEGVKAAEEGIIYLRVDDTGTLKDYVGQAESDARYLDRQGEHADDYPGSSFSFHELDRAPPGQPLDVAEESWIRAGGGPTNLSNPNGGLSNGRYQMNDGAYRAAGGTVPLPGQD
jgi:RHS repeat-associated protein